MYVSEKITIFVQQFYILLKKKTNHTDPFPHSNLTFFSHAGG